MVGLAVPDAVVALAATGAPRWSLVAIAAIGVVGGVALVRVVRRGGTSGEAPAQPSPESPAPERTRPDDHEARTIPGMLKQGRHAYVIRQHEQWADGDDAEELLMRAVEQLEARLALVPDGTVTLRRSLAGQADENDKEVSVPPFLIDTVEVSNAMFQHFVDMGGYENADLWPEDILPLVLEFRDTTGEPGPRFWAHGQYPRGQATLPVVGVNYYEAAAFARWIGQRLPNEAEWQMAANWRVAGSSKTYQRTFPWGDTMDHTKCNLWLSKKCQPVDVGDYPEGSAPNDVRQLIGNVWEWTTSDFEVWHESGQPVRLDDPVKCIRGGAYDTFFETQATSEFRTAQNPLARKHNVGFRCALTADEIPVLVSA
jgi:iron(II)-dependent oxidoreductase